MKRKIFSTLFALALVVSFSLIPATPVAAADIPSSTLLFEGELTLDGDGHLVGTIPMAAGTYYMPGGPGTHLVGDEWYTPDERLAKGGFDVYAKEGGTLYCDYDDPPQYIPPTQLIVNHDAWSLGGWDGGYVPYFREWASFELKLTSDHWYLRNTAVLAPPGEVATAMSGTLTWHKDGTGYAEETDFGSNLRGVDLAALGGGAQALDWDIGYPLDPKGPYTETFPLEYPGFDVAVTEVSGVYTVTLTPAALANPDDPDGQADLGVDVVQPTLTVNIVGEGTVKWGVLKSDPLESGAFEEPTNTKAFDAETAGELTKVRLVFNPDPGWFFDGWTGDGDQFLLIGVDVTMDGDKEVTATFVPKTISIEISPSLIDFGPIIQGGTGTDSLNVANNGNVPVSVTAGLANEVPLGFYTDNLKMNNLPVINWVEELDPSDSVSVPLTLEIPLGAAPGPKTGTIIFWAEDAQ